MRFLPHISRALVSEFPLRAMLAASLSVTSCSGAALSPPPIVQPGAPGEATKVITPQAAVERLRVAHTAADVRFMQGMIGHHAQALEMTALLSSRTAREDMRLLARRIELSQADEIRLMQRWLEARGEPVPDAHAHHTPGATLMPGMLSPDEMSVLAAATGHEFDRLFLEFMIRHHDGALIMVRELFANTGAAQEPDLFGFVSDIEADQLIEIDRMSSMLAEVGK